MRDAILKRESTRTFKNEALTKAEIDLILTLVKKHENYVGPFDHSFEFTFSLNNSSDSNGKKIGTYGFLRNVPSFIGGVCQNDFLSIVDFGFVFEHLILDLTSHDFDTCWLGGTFKRQNYRKELEENEIIPAISPVGHRAINRTFLEKATRSLAKSQSRLPLSHLFKNYSDFSNVILDLDNPVIHSLSLVRKAPSASNKQPWRAYVDENIVHFYIERTAKYPRVSLKYDIQALDMGIALCHFEMGINHFNKKATYFKEKEPKEIPNNEYVISVKVSK
ncbi:MAG: hypothetical protein KJ847_01345 [Firmicutes bacterium]|nr:hypothetical protein [Bacillota bacterium]